MTPREKLADTLKQNPPKFVLVAPEDEVYTVFRFRHLLHFIPEGLVDSAVRRMKLAKTAGFGSGTQLLYLSTYVIDTNDWEIVKNRYPDDELPRAVFDALFSGVIPDVRDV